MRYIIMCGGPHVIDQPTPKPLFTVNGERIIERTIRLLREQGVKKSDIVISSEDDRFSEFGVKVVKHRNYQQVRGRYYWLNCFYPIRKPACFLMGDVCYSPKAIETIINTETDDIMFFASAKPFSPYYIKTYAEPFAFKVQNVKRFWECVNKAKQLNDMGKFNRECISWELWQVIRGTTLNRIITNYKVINDYTVDVDDAMQLKRIEDVLRAVE